MSNGPSATAPTWGRYELMLPDEIEAIMARHPTAYLPWGALEYHGRHAAVGLDGLKAHALCVALAQAEGGLVLPPVWIASNTIKIAPKLNFPRHSLDFPEDAVRTLARLHLAQLADEGFKTIFILPGHVGQPHYDILKAEAAAFGAAHRNLAVVATSECDLLPGDLVVVNHAALGEVAFLMAAYPKCVDLARLPRDRAPTLEQDAVWGPDPRPATAALGKKLTAAFVAAARPRLAEARAQLHQ